LNSIGRHLASWGNLERTRPLTLAKTQTQNSNAAAANGSGTKAIDRALHVLSSFVEFPDQGISEIALRSGLSPSTVHRIVRALVHNGYLDQDGETDRYHLGHAAHVLGESAREAWSFDRALPVLERIGSITGESVNLGILDGTEVVVIQRVESVQPLRFDQPPGSRISVHCSSMGKSLMAHAEQLPPLDFVAVTPASITSIANFEKDLAGVRKRGYSTDHEESIPGVSCVATAILNSDGDAVAAIAVQGPTVRMTNERMQAIGAQIIESASEIQQLLGFRRDPTTT